jgi:hypothetical protein
MGDERMYFSDAIRDAAKARNENLNQAAQQIDVSASSLRTWINRNTYPEPALENLAEYTGNKDASDLQSKFIFRIARPRQPSPTIEAISEKKGNLRDCLEYLVETTRRSTRSLAMTPEQLEKFITTFFNTMAADDVFIMYCFDVLPLEFILMPVSRIYKALATAIDKGAHFIYMWPEQSILETMNKSVLPLDKPVDFQARFDSLLKRVRDLCAKDPGDKLISLRSKNHGFCAPGHKYTLYKNGDIFRAWASFPSGEGGNNFNVPLDYYTTHQFINFIENSQEKEEDTKKLKNILAPIK